MQRKDLLEKNIEIFKEQGMMIEKYASRDTKILVVGNPANTNCFVLRNFAPSIPDKNFSCLTRLDMNRAISMIALRLKVSPIMVKNVIIWGNHSDTQFPDVNHGVVLTNSGSISIRNAINDDEYLNTTYISSIQKRGIEIIQKRGIGSALSASKAIIDHVKNWMCGTAPGEHVSMGVVSDGSYGIEKGLVYSFPVSCQNGAYEIVQNLILDNFEKEKMKITMDELISERDIALNLLK